MTPVRTAGRRPTVALLLVGLAVLSAGCAGEEQSGTPAQGLATWARGTGFDATVATLQSDSARVGEAVRRHLGTGVLHTVCGVLTTDAEQANTELPAPDDALTQDLAKAYSLDYDAGNDCFTGGPRLLARSAREQRAADALLRAALARARTVAGPGGGSG